MEHISQPLTLSPVVGEQPPPPVPTGYTIHLAEHNGQEVFVCRAPKDKRKSQARVSKEPKYWILMSAGNGKHFWIPESDFPTRPVREFMIAQGLQMEIKINGFRMTAKAPKCSTILRQEYGMKGTPESLLKQFIAFRQIDLGARGEPAMMELR
jgi:hypothetical protein